MDTKNFNKLLASTKEVKEILDGKKNPSRKFEFEELNPKDIRTKLSLTQKKFASFLNVSVPTLRNWEQGIKKPQGPVKVLLDIINNNPKLVLT